MIWTEGVENVTGNGIDVADDLRNVVDAIVKGDAYWKSVENDGYVKQSASGDDSMIDVDFCCVIAFALTI